MALSVAVTCGERCFQNCCEPLSKQQTNTLVSEKLATWLKEQPVRIACVLCPRLELMVLSLLK